MTKLKDSLKQVRDDMVQEDLERDKEGSELSKLCQDKILNKNSPKIKKFFKKKYMAIAASLVLVLGLVYILPNMFLAGFNKYEHIANESQAIHDNFPDNITEDSNDMPESPDLGQDYVDNAKKEDNIEEDSDIYVKDPADANKKVVYYYNYTIESLDLKQIEKDIKELIKSTGSYISDGQIYMENNNKYATLKVRVPREKSSEFQNGLKSIGTIVSQSISSKDMTKSYRDLEAEKLSQDIKEKKLQELLKKAENIEDVLAIEKELAIIEAEKAQISKQMDEINRDVDYQYFSLEIYEVNKTGNPLGKELNLGDKISLQFTKSIEDLVSFFENALLLIVRNWILIIILALAAVFAIRKFSKRNRK